MMSASETLPSGNMGAPPPIRIGVSQTRGMAREPVRPRPGLARHFAGRPGQAIARKIEPGFHVLRLCHVQSLIAAFDHPVAAIAICRLAAKAKSAAGQHERAKIVKGRAFLIRQGPVPAIAANFGQKTRAGRHDFDIELAAVNRAATFQIQTHMVAHKGAKGYFHLLAG